MIKKSKIDAAVNAVLGEKDQFLSVPKGRSFQLMKGLMTSFSVSGDEVAAQKIVIDYLHQHTDFKVRELNPYHDTVAVLNPGKAGGVSISSHLDKIGFAVLYVTDKGLIIVKRIGGSNPQISIGGRATLKTRTGKEIRCVSGWPAMHILGTMKDKPDATNEKNLHFNAGFRSKKEAEDAGIMPGDLIMMDSTVELLNGNVSGVLDNQIGVFIDVMVCAILNELNVDFGVHAVFNGQEELGTKGSIRTAQYMKEQGINLAIFTDVCHNTNARFVKKDQHGDIVSDKVAIARGPSISTMHENQAFEVAEEFGINVQAYLAAYKSAFITGTDLDPVAEVGIPSILFSLPSDYMHSGIEMALVAAVYDLIKLKVATVIRVME